MERLLSLRRNIAELPKVDSSPEKEVAKMPTPPHFTDYKKKGNGIDKRTMRVHRRSIDQRKMRDQAFYKGRAGLDKMSPLKEVQNVNGTQQQGQAGGIKTKTKQAPKGQVQELKDRLKKWKEEKELKKKLESGKNKPRFKVHHIEVEKPKFNFGRSKTMQSPQKKTTTRARVTSSSSSKTTQSTTTAQPTRVTRSSARVANSKPTALTAPAPVRQSKQKQPTTTQRSTRSGSQSSQSTVSQPQKKTRSSSRTQSTKSTGSQKQQSTRSSSRSQSNASTKSTGAQKTTRSSSRSRSVKSTESQVNTDGSNVALPQWSSDASSGEDSSTDSQTAPVQEPEDMVAESSTGEESGEESTPFFQQATQVNAGSFNFNFNLAYSSASSGDESAPEPATPVFQEPVADMAAESSKVTMRGNTDAMALFEFRLPSTTSPIKESPFTFRLPAASTTSPSEETSGENKETVSTEDEEAKQVDVVATMEVVDEEAPCQDSVKIDVEEANKSEIGGEAPTTTAGSLPEDTMVVESAVSANQVMQDQDDKASSSSVVDGKVEEAVVVPPAEEKKVEEETKAENVQEETKATEVVRDEDKDVGYFRQLICTETKRLTKLCDKWQDVIKGSLKLSEDVSGEIRTTMGKAQLLMNQRFKQFNGLVDNCEFNLGELKTHCTDLIGFWEMVAYQVEDIERMFVDLDKLKANNWVKEEAKKVNKKPVAKKLMKKKPKQTEASKKAAAERVAARQRMMAARNAMKAKATRSKDSEKVVFDAGFFKVESPVKSPKVHCAAGAGSPISAAFLRRTSRTPGSRHGTPVSQAFNPKNPRLSLCGTLSNLVLSESSPAGTGDGGMTTRSRQGTPVAAGSSTPSKDSNQSITPSRVKLGMPFGIRPSMQFTPLPGCSPYGTRSSPRMQQGTPGAQQFVPKPSTPLAAMTTRSPLAAKPSTPLIAMVTPLKEATPVSAATRGKTPRSRKRPSPRNESTHLLIPGIGSPAKQRDSSLLIPGVASPMITVRDTTCNASIFTPPQKATPTTSSSDASVVSDLICLDSPLVPTSAITRTPLPPTTSTSDPVGSLKCFAAINATPDMKELLGTDMIMSPVRRSGRLRHASASQQVVVDSLASMPDDADYGYQPNMSLL